MKHFPPSIRSGHCFAVPATKNSLFLIFRLSLYATIGWFWGFYGMATHSSDLSLNYHYYMTPTHIKNTLNQYTSFKLNAKYHHHSGSLFYGAQGMGEFFIDISNQKYMAAPNLFFGYKLPDINNYSINLIVGRYQQSMSILYEDQKSTQNPWDTQPEFWSVMDEIWEMGIWQSQINWDYLSPKGQGLIGTPLLNIKKDPWMLTLFLSGLSVPDHGPAVDITPKGRIQSGSRWFIPPKSNFVLFNQRIDTLYWLDTLYIKQILLNDSVAIRFRFGDIHKQWMSMAYANKPINQIYFTADSGFSINETTINNVIYYQPFDHSVFSIDFGVRESWGWLVLSVIQEHPRPKQVARHQIIPVLPNTILFSSHLRINTSPYLFTKYINFNAIYSQMSTDHQTANNKITDQLSQAIPNNRFKLHRGFSVSAKSKNIPIGTQSVCFNIRYWHSLPEEGNWLHSSLQWNITPRLHIKGGMDILGAARDKGFFYTYRHNDRITMQVSYAIN